MNEQCIVITDFLFFEGRNGRIYADQCKIYLDFGIFLYKDDKLICFVKDKVQKVDYIEVSDSRAHYYIKGNDLNSYYLVTKDMLPNELYNLNDQVIIKGNDSMSLSMALAKDETFLERFQKEIERDFFWTVIDKKENIMLVLQKGEEQKYVSIEDVISLEMIKENAKFFKETSFEKERD